MAHLFTTAYPESNKGRRAELLDCLNRNLNNPHITHVFILTETQGALPLPEHRKLSLRRTDHRPTYDDFFAWINEAAGPDDISLIANSDIYFDDSIAMLDSLVDSGRCLALSRWDVLPNRSPRLFERGDSQDVWAFRGQVRAGVRGGFPLGVYDCDNKIAWELEKAGYKVRNPALGLRTYHLHLGTDRSYDPREPPDHGIRPPFRYIEPDTPGSLWQCFRLWRQYRPGYFPWRVTWNRFLHTPVGKPVRYLRNGLRRRLR